MIIGTETIFLNSYSFLLNEGYMLDYGTMASSMNQLETSFHTKRNKNREKEKKKKRT
jgi:hypothetical protein